MTVAALPSTALYVEDGVSTAFPVPFRFKSAGDLIVERLFADGSVVPLTLNVDYTVIGGTTDAGGTLTRTAATSGAKLYILRRTPRAQPMVYTPNDRFPAKSHEGALDTLTLIAQEQQDQVDGIEARSPLAPVGETIGPLPPEADRTDRLTVFNAGGDLDAMDSNDVVVVLDSLKRPRGMPVARVMQEIGSTIIDDGAWTEDGPITTDGAWG